MTFILNVLHRKFSLLASDTKGNAAGPVTITAPGITLHLPPGGTIYGFRKLHTNPSIVLAVGIARNTNDHPYVAVIEQSTSVNEALAVIRKHMDDFLIVNDRAAVLKLGSYMENQGIVTFFDVAQNAYFSNLHIFSVMNNATGMYRPAAKGVRLLQVGTGSNVFEKAVGLDNIRSFSSSIQSSGDVGKCLTWLKDAFEKVSKLDDGSGDQVAAVLSTRNNPEFRSFDGTDH